MSAANHLAGEIGGESQFEGITYMCACTSYSNPRAQQNSAHKEADV